MKILIHFLISLPVLVFSVLHAEEKEVASALTPAFSEFSNGDFGKGLLLARKVSEEFPNSAFVWKTIGCAEVVLKKYDIAVHSLERALDNGARLSDIADCYITALIWTEEYEKIESLEGQIIGLNDMAAPIVVAKFSLLVEHSNEDGFYELLRDVPEDLFRDESVVSAIALGIYYFSQDVEEIGEIPEHPKNPSKIP